MEWYKDQDVTVFMTVKNPDGTASNPSSVRFHVKPPSGVVTQYELGVEGTETLTPGERYSLTFDLASAGPYRIRAEALEGEKIVGLSETSLFANPSNVL